MQQTNKHTSIKYVYLILICYNIFRSLLLPTPGRRTRIQTMYKQSLLLADLMHLIVQNLEVKMYVV